jgi:starch-binding outer membrane protein, SusD/RagB family
MNRIINRARRSSLALLLAGVAALGACDLDLQDPNRPTEGDIFRTRDGIQAVAVGLQAVYADEIRNPIWVTGLVTDEIGALLPNTFSDFQDIDRGAELRRGFFNTSPFDPWTGMYVVVKLADDLLREVPNAGFAPGMSSGMLALARLHKAMAFGHLIQLYERIPIEVGRENPQPQFVDRQAALAEILRLLDEARAEIQANPPSDAFRTQVLAPGFDLANTINAMRARYALIAGNHALAISAAQSVNLNVRSELRFSANDPNPLWNLWYNAGNAYQMRPEQRFRTQAETGDRRVQYWVQPATGLQGASGPLDELNRYRTAVDPLPLYLPGEMHLIQAEAYARTNQLPQAREMLNAVRTQCASQVDEPLACLPALGEAQLATQQAILAEILRQREYELFLQGLRFEDLRRFGAPRKYPWMPYPASECDRNPNAPRGFTQATPWLCN